MIPDRFQTVCKALNSFFDFTGRWDEQLALSRDAESRALAAKDFSSAGWRAYEVATVHYRRGESADVVACADRAQAHWRRAQTGAREQAVAITLRGHGHAMVKDYPAAIAAYREVVEVHRALNAESTDVAIGLNDLASAEAASGELDAAERDYREALRIANAGHDREGVTICIGNLAGCALDRKDWLGAETMPVKR